MDKLRAKTHTENTLHSENMQTSTHEPSDEHQDSGDDTSVAEVEELSHEILSRPQVLLHALDRPEIQRIIVAHEAFSGPFPHPRHLKGYEDVLPGSAERIFSMTEREMAHRHRMEEKVLDSAVSRDRRGQILGVISTLAALGAASYLSMHDHDGVAITIIGVIVAVAGIFVLRKYPLGRGRDQDKAQEPEDDPKDNQNQ
ncbi:DUF2335 domain-containing protein [Enterobacter kobei]|uniref:DUF2335 domain-containing protein n=1 Tax=Enterobacter kobei TaxID=208224 RepID=UPI0021C13361|nr:DUF2335 domain-containing protein [Enterobacter kobei]UXJ66742.1 DUF2335 domain-containing protein [Enterobacter kobei]